MFDGVYVVGRAKRARLLRGLLAVSTVAAAFLAPTVASGATPLWQTPLEVPNTATLNVFGNGATTAVSCSSSGQCAAAGYYLDGTGSQQAFVANEVNGVWQNAEAIPGTIALNGSGSASVTALSCTAPGYCSVGGNYYDGSGNYQGFVADEVGGVWQNAVEVPGTAALNFGNGEVSNLSCAAPGDCSAAGYYADSSGNQQGFVADEVNGVWQNAVEIPGTATLNINGDALVNGLSCTAPGDCSVGGNYYDNLDNQQVFVADEVNGVWQNAVEVPGTAALNANGYAQVGGLSCYSAGNCSVGGFYHDSLGRRQVFVANEVNGAWQSAIEVPGTATLNLGGYAEVDGLSCASAGVCAAVGTYVTGSHQTQVFVANEVNGVWGAATDVSAMPGGPGLTIVEDLAIACVAGGCVITGNYLDAHFNFQPFSVLEVNGVLSTAAQIPVTATLDPNGVSQAIALSCSADGYCVLGGSYGFSVDPDAFVVNGQLSFAAPPSNLVVNESPGSLVATWTGGAGATSYTCTLLYGFVEPSTFTEVVLTPSCAFYGLNPAADYGVSVVANVGSSESIPLVGYAVYPKYAAGTSGSRPAITTIICVKGVQVREVRGRNPRCPAGFRKVG